MDAGSSGQDAVPHLKARLLAHVAGLDRGFAATGRQVWLQTSVVMQQSTIWLCWTHRLWRLLGLPCSRQCSSIAAVCKCRCRVEVQG